MAQGRREQLRFTMLPHLGAKKIDADRFMRTGAVFEYKAYPIPDSPELDAEIKRLQEENARRNHGR